MRGVEAGGAGCELMCGSLYARWIAGEVSVSRVRPAQCLKALALQTNPTAPAGMQTVVTSPRAGGNTGPYRSVNRDRPLQATVAPPGARQQWELHRVREESRDLELRSPIWGGYVKLRPHSVHRLRALAATIRPLHRGTKGAVARGGQAPPARVESVPEDTRRRRDRAEPPPGRRVGVCTTLTLTAIASCSGAWRRASACGTCTLAMRSSEQRIQDRRRR